MKCPNCKSPIDDKSFVCEWCGTNLNKTEKDNFQEETIQVKPQKKPAAVKKLPAEGDTGNKNIGCFFGVFFLIIIAVVIFLLVVNI